MPKKNWLIITVVIIIIFIIIYAFIKPAHLSKPKEVFKIGAILPLTGNLAFMGEMEKNAISLAQKDIDNITLTENKRIEIILGDSKGDNKEAAALAQKFIQIDKVNALWTSLTGVSFAVEPIATANKVLQIAFCMDPDISKRSPYVFRLYEGMMEEGQALMNFLKEDKLSKSVGIIYVRIPATEKVVNYLFIPELKKQGKDIKVIESYELQNRDFRNLLIKVGLARPDILIIYDYGFSLPFIYDGLNATGLLNKVKILGGWGYLYSLISGSVRPSLLEGVVVAGPKFITEKTQKAVEFISKFKQSFNMEPNFDGGFTYDSMMILYEALKKCTSFDINNVITNLAEIKDYEGVMGTMTISDRELKVEMTIGVIESGKVVPLSKR